MLFPSQIQRTDWEVLRDEWQRLKVDGGGNDAGPQPPSNGADESNADGVAAAEQQTQQQPAPASAQGAPQQQAPVADQVPAARPVAGAAAAAAGRQLLGLQLSFTLPASCYATMLVRELTKASTSKAAHRALSEAQQQQGGAAEEAAGHGVE